MPRVSQRYRVAFTFGTVGHSVAFVNNNNARRVAQAVADYLKGHSGRAKRTPPVIVAYDQRFQSDAYACEIARVIDGRIPVDAHRSPEMPVWGRVISTEFADPGIREEVTRGKVSALVLYLRSIQVE